MFIVVFIQTCRSHRPSGPTWVQLMHFAPMTFLKVEGDLKEEDEPIQPPSSFGYSALPIGLEAIGGFLTYEVGSVGKSK